MTEHIWDKYLTARDKQVLAVSGYGATRQGYGKRPALIVIDVSYAFTGEKPEPILESIKKWRTSCGENSLGRHSSNQAARRRRSVRRASR